MLDRFSNPGSLPTMVLIKLRDLSSNFWNADTLYVLTPDAASARRLAEVIEQEGREVLVHDDQRDVESALGSGREKRAVVSIWWDHRR